MKRFSPLLCTLTLSWLHLSINSSILTSMACASLLQDSFAVLVFNLFYLTNTSLSGSRERVGACPSYIWVGAGYTQLIAGHHLGGRNLGGLVPCSTVTQWCSEGILAPPPTTRTLVMFFVCQGLRALRLSAQSHTTWADLFYAKHVYLLGFGYRIKLES